LVEKYLDCFFQTTVLESDEDMDLNPKSGKHRWRGRLIKAGGGILLIFGTGLSVFTWKVFSPPSVERLPLPKTLVSLESPEGQQLLNQSKSKQDFQPLSTHIETQKRPAFCGVASSVMVLNALGSKRQGYRPLTQDTFFNSQTQSIRSSYTVTFSGMTLDELAALLRSHNIKVEVYYASGTTLNQFRTQAKANLARSGDYIIVNYQRSVLGQSKSGHISPLAAYHEQSDRFLIEDVASYKYPPVWASTENLWKAMNTTDSISQKTRGYLVVRQ
jgi:hypothetical protein